MSGYILARPKHNYWYLVSLSAIAVFTILLVYTAMGAIPQHYSLLPLLPFVCAIMYFIIGSCGNRKFSSTYVIILGLTFLRYCIQPLFMIFGNYSTLMKMNITENANAAILLMLYEAIVIFLILIRFAYIDVDKYAKKDKSHSQRPHLRILGSVLLLLTAFCVLVFVFIPETQNAFSSIFDIVDDDFTVVKYDSANSAIGFKRALQTLFSMFFQFLRIMIPLWFILLLKKKGYSENTVCIIALIFVFLQFLFITSTFAESIISALVILLMTTHLCKKRGKTMMKLTLLLVCGIIILFFYVRYTVRKNTGTMYDGVGLSYISNISNAYLLGIDNVAAVFNVPSDKKWSALFYNIYGAIPFNTTLFGLSGEKLQSLYNTANNSYGQIVPTIGSGYYFFGPIFAPTFSALITYFSLKCDVISDCASNYWKHAAYKFTAIVFALGIAMYSEAIVLSWFVAWCLPLIILSKFATDNISI